MSKRKKWAVAFISVSTLTETSEWQRQNEGSSNLHSQANAAAEMLERHAMLGFDIAVRLIPVES